MVTLQTEFWTDVKLVIKSNGFIQAHFKNIHYDHDQKQQQQGLH
jgi:hypothetical protein